MKGQYEQHCNAVALKHLGVPSIKSLKKKNIENIVSWIEFGKPVEVDYPDNAEEIVDTILSDFQKNRTAPLLYTWGNKEIRKQQA